MPKIESSNIEVYIKQLISESLGNDVKSRKHILCIDFKIRSVFFEKSSGKIYFNQNDPQIPA